MKSGEAGKIPVGSDPLTAMLDSEGGMVGVGYQISTSPSRQAKEPEEIPVARAREQRPAIPPISQGAAEIESHWKRSRIPEHPGMGHYPHKSAEDQFGHGKGRVLMNDTLQPTPKLLMARRLGAVGVYQNVDIA